jgi:alkylation response protein AidB-like acyl-CoA dehydrogenase
MGNKAMTVFNAPIKDMNFTMNHVCDLANLAACDGMESADPEMIAQALEEAGKLAGEVLAPINQTGDQQGAVLENGVVRTPDGFKEAYAAYQEGGWNSVPFDEDFGGMGLPMIMGVACNELWNAANMGFSLCPLLTVGAVEAISAHGSDEQKVKYLPKLVSGEWTGTMNLTEPQAGSDVGALRAKAVPAADGSWRVKGQKIFITYGEHDYTDNIIHLVLARTPGSPSGTRGISLFIVPKFLVNDDGSLGARNDLAAVSLEHKCGIHASPTAIMSYGDNDGAIAYMLGEENKGMRCMFTMMNNARLNVGIQGVAIAERAYQQAAAYANDRKQGVAMLPPSEPGSSPIVDHADVRRMLMTMRSQTQAVRAICYLTAQAIDFSRHHPDPDQRAWFEGLQQLLTPIAKSWSTDVGCEVASIGMQVHGGMGFIEETGAAQHYRDIRIAPIYEGTNGIQAMDLVMRKLTLQGGELVATLIAEMRGIDDDLAVAGDDFASTRTALSDAINSLETATHWMLQRMGDDPNTAAAGSTPYLKMFGLTLGGYLLAKGALAAKRLLADGNDDRVFLIGRIATARFYGEQLLPQVGGLLAAATASSDILYAIDAEALMAQG